MASGSDDGLVPDWLVDVTPALETPAEVRDRDPLCCTPARPAAENTAAARAARRAAHRHGVLPASH